MQDANTDELVFSVAQLIEYYSQFYLFRPGDVVEVEVQGVGVLRNPLL